MKLVMAVSRDGWLARDAEDDMSWLGSTDKAVFRILTGVGGVVGVSHRTAECMPGNLPGRRVIFLSRYEKKTSHVMALEDFQHSHPDGWLIGGPTLAHAAMEARYLDEVHLCRSDRCAFPTSKTCVKDWLTPWLEAPPIDWYKRMYTKILDVTVECWRYVPS
jgi:dihydrofolate reductase